ncbi:GAF domain-containing protein [Deinococcus sp. S9]|uniref:GAF domain-containing protein n=1 Tax=Deinococcus sp. S9 TaxID=2545754 RepID=UPI0014053A54|nr:GAF domain-containing protein [Deinococcus sp. S9]
MAVPPPTNEAARLAALARYRVLDTPPEEAFDRIARLATQVLNVACAAVNFVDAERTFTKSCQGLELAGASLPAGAIPCSWAVLTSEPLLIEDLSTDPRFCDHPLVTGRHLRMYAGMPLLAPGGEVLGTLCVLDPRVRRLDAREQDILRSLAALLTDQLELRLKTSELAQARALQALVDLEQQALPLEDTAERVLALLHAQLPLAWSGLLQLTPEGLEVRHDRAEVQGEAFREGIRQSAWGKEIGPALIGPAPLFLDHRPAWADAFPPPQEAEPGGVAWLPLGDGHDGVHHALALVRLDRPGVWLPEERLLLEKAASCLSAALTQEARLEAGPSDSLTGLLARGALQQALGRADQQRAGDGLGYVLGVVKLGGLQQVRDSYGHVHANHLLREFARQLKAPGLTAYRLDGDEYALLHLWPALPEVAAQELATLVAGAAGALHRLGYPVEAALGVASVPEDAPEGAGALRAARRRRAARERERRNARQGR